MEIINSRLYNLNDPELRAEIVASGKAQLAASGSAIFPNFVREEALADMASEATEKFASAHRRDQMLNINPSGKLAEIGDADLVERRSPYRMWVLGSDLLETDRSIKEIYHSEALIALARDILGIDALHPTADPLVNVNLTYMGDGDQHGWHFDGNDFVISILIQKPKRGGDFEFTPNADELPLVDVNQIIDGTSQSLQRIDVQAGTLVLFQGRKALHRVSPVGGDKHRIISLLSYHTTPGFTFPDSVKMNGLGRIYQAT